MSVASNQYLYRFISPFCATLLLACFAPTLSIAESDVLPDVSANSDHAHAHDHEQHGDTETIVVTASPLEHDRDELSVPVDILERDELILHLGSTLGETLSRLPGVTTSGFAAGASRPVIRGQDAYRTEVLEDGLRTQDVSKESPDHAVPVNPLAAKRVEVVRGPATLRYGGGASAGVVNVITDRVPDQIGEQGVTGEIFGGIGLVANQRDLAASIDANHGNFAIHADGVFREASDYSTPNDDKPRIQSGTKTDSWMGSVGGAWIGENGRLGASYTRIENKYGLPEEDATVDIDMHADRFRFEGDLFEPIEGIREVRARGVYTDYEHDEIADGDVGQTYRNEEFDGRLEVLHEEIAGFTGAFGLHGQHRDFRGEGEAAEFLSPAERRAVAIYFFEERPLAESLNLEAGFRYENTRVQGVDIGDVNRDKTFDAVSGALGLVATPLDWLTIGANGSISQRAPAIVELLARGAHEATATFERGDADLDLETSFTGDFRIEAHNDRGRIEWASFVTQYDDYIFAALTGNDVDEDGALGGDLTELAYTSRDALFYGFEVSGDLELLEYDFGTLGIDGRFDYVRARFDGNGSGGSNNVPRITPLRWGGGLWFDHDSTNARVGFIRNEAQDETGDSETNTKSYTFVEASITHTWEIDEDKALDFSITGQNLTDVRAQNAVAFNKDDVLLPGRNIRFGLRARF
jgi:iron complex outermembrane receptor protein